jgi:hypothetical protein
MKSPLPLSLLFIALSATASMNAATIVVTDPTRTTSPVGDIIDPNDTRNVSFNATGTGFTSQATIEAVTGVGSLQNYSGFSGNSNANSYIVSFTDATLPDLQFTFSGSPSGSATAINNDSFATSASSSLRLGTSAVSTSVSMRIDLGSYNGSTFSTGVNAVKEFAFTLSGNFDRVNGSVAVTYFDALNNALSTQSLTSMSANVAGYTGFQSGTSNISYVTVGYTANASGVGVLGFDDLAFSTVAVPEPSSYAAIVGGLGLAFVGLRRRRRSV